MNRKNKSSLLATNITIALTLLALLFVSCAGSQSGASDNVVSEIAMSTAVDENGRPLNPTTVFTTEADGFYCSFKLSNFPVGSRLKAALVYVGGEAEDEVGQNYVIEVNTGSIEREGKGYTYTVFGRPIITDYKWPKGDYKVVLSADDQEKASTYFKVE